MAEVEAPPEEVKILFWVKVCLGLGKAHALRGSYRDGQYWHESRPWDPSEVLQWRFDI